VTAGDDIENLTEPLLRAVATPVAADQRDARRALRTGLVGIPWGNVEATSAEAHGLTHW
jgi:hypothetical protein